MPKTKIDGGESPVLRQIAALPLRDREGQLEVCLVTTRETKRWTIPKGWPMKGLKDFAAARIEAEQEAGVTGEPDKKPLGSFNYWKRRDTRFDLIHVDVYTLKVTKYLPKWKEQAERQVMWASPADAAIAVDEPELAVLLKAIAARRS